MAPHEEIVTYSNKEDVKLTSTSNGHSSKMFSRNDSPLTELMKIKDLKTIYHICISVLISLFINAFAYDFIKNGEIKLGVDVIIAGFGKFYWVIMIWIFMFLFTFLCYVSFALWAKVRCKLNPKSISERSLDRFGLFSVIAYYALLLYFPVKLLLHFQLAPVSRFVVLMEQVRLLMKSHAFIRSNTPKILNYKSHAEQADPRPSVSNFLYFMFAPTLVYRDEYPRTNMIRWGYVAKCFLEVLCIIFYISLIMDHFFFDIYHEACRVKNSLFDILLNVLLNTIPALIIFLCVFYCILHSWLNAWAEMLTFADRVFYKDWWNSTTYARYYRTWNVVVNDWLYTYIYKDVYETICFNNKVATKLMVFFISAAFHEYILSFSLGNLFPILFVNFFGPGVLFTFINHESSIGNIFIWYSIGLGYSTCICLYGIEFHARMNCPGENMSYFVPRFLTCDCF